MHLFEYFVIIYYQSVNSQYPILILMAVCDNVNIVNINNYKKKEAIFMSYDFSSIINRSNTGSVKWSPIDLNADYADVFPFSTADMEFATAPAIKKACVDFAERGFYCYTIADEKYRNVVCDFMKRRHNWNIRPEWIVTTYGIVSAINTAVRCFTDEGDGVIIQRPVYYPFTNAIVNNNRKVINNALLLEGGKYQINFEELEELAKDERTKMMIFCSPHNPVGRVWTREELFRVAEICYNNNVILISDEIHFDIVRAEHNVIATVDKKFSNNIIVCTAISKTFNIAGLFTSNIIIESEDLRARFCERINKDGYGCINSFAYPATLAAYTECDDWIAEMNRQIRKNFETVRTFISEKLPEVWMSDAEGTYLAWIDVSALGIPDEELVSTFVEKVGIIPSEGKVFGDEGSGFIRLNIAVPEVILMRALEGLEKLSEERK